MRLLEIVLGLGLHYKERFDRWWSHRRYLLEGYRIHWRYTRALRKAGN